MSVTLIWLVSIVAAAYLANEKKQSIIMYVILAFATGPLAVIILLLISPHKDLPATKIKNTQGISNFEDMRQEMEYLKSINKTLVERMDRLDAILNTVSKLTIFEKQKESLGTGGAEGEPLTRPQPQRGRVEVPQRQDPLQNLGKNTDTPIKPFDLEMAFGKNWLSKIGIVVFTLGIVFLISYTFKYFGPFIKIMFGYLVSVVLFLVGKKLEHKEKFVNFGRVLWGGGWAIAYFTTYAMHHFEASRLIADPYVSLILQGLLVIGLLYHVVKYKNEDMMALALFAAYVATTMGQVTNFTLLSCTLLAGIVLFLVYRFQWIKTLALGVILTYGIHQIWVMPHIVASGGKILLWTVATAQFAQMLNFSFLIVYILVFLIATHIAKTADSEKHENILAAVNVGNIVWFSFLVYPIIIESFYIQRFILVFTAGLVFLVLALIMKKSQHLRLYQSDLIAAAFLLTCALPLKFAVLSSLLIWLIEIPFLLLIATQFKEKIYAYLAYALTGYVSFYFLLNHASWAAINIFGIQIEGNNFLYFMMSVVSAISFYIVKKDQSIKNEMDLIFEYFFPAAASLSMAILLYEVIARPWLSIVLSVEGIVLLVLSFMMMLKRFRVYAYSILLAAIIYFLDQRFYSFTPAVKWANIVVNLAISWTVYFVINSLSLRKKEYMILKGELQAVFIVALIILVYSIFNHLPESLISLGLGLSAVVLILSGIFDKNKTQRLGGLVVFAIALCRVVLVDLSGLDIIFKIITFIVLGLLFLGASFVYNRFGVEK